MYDGTAAAPALAPQRYLVQPILPLGTIHVVSGPSGTGKSQWVLQLLADLHAGRDILGCQSFPVPFVYVSLKQSDQEIRDILEQAQIAPSAITYITLADHDERYDDRERPCDPASLIPTFSSVLAHAFRRDASMRLLVIDGIDELIPSGRHSDPQVINTFLAELRAACRRHRLTIIVIGAPAKAKDGETYSNVRQRVSGSVVWGPGTSTHINIEFSTPDLEDRSRRIAVSCRRAGTKVHQWRFDEYGILVPALECDITLQMESWLSSCSEGETIATNQVRAVALSYGISPRSLHRWLRGGGMVDAGHGKWRVPARTIH